MGAPDRYAVIGNPIAHSKSPGIHASFARQTAQNLSYERLLAPLDGFPAAVERFVREGGRGANVTVPFKLQACALASLLTERARAAGAVNTLRFDGVSILGDNTDGVGMVTDITQNAGVALDGSRFLLRGAGGAARGVLLPLVEQQPDQLMIANRTEAKAAELASRFAAGGRSRVRASGFASLDGRFDVIINATAASLAAELPPIPATVFGPGSFAYDMMYGSAPTVFLHFAQQHGAAVRDGLGMLVEQAAESFFVWRGIRPGTAAVYDELRDELRAGLS